MEYLVSNVLDPRGLPYTYDQTDVFVTDAPGAVLGYVSHGTHGGAPAGYILDEQNGLQFELAAGAAFHTWESFNAYSFEEGGNKAGQGLVAEWINRGGTVGTGHVEEPGVGIDTTTNEDRIFEMLLNGYTWAEAAWNATCQLSYVNTVVGDPLMVYQAWTPGDANGDGVVSADDFISVQTNFGHSGVPGILGDANFDGVVMADDYATVQANFGAHHPEPATLGLLLIGGLALLRRRR